MEQTRSVKKLNNYYKKKLISYNLHGFSYSGNPKVRKIIESITFLAILQSRDRTQSILQISFKINQKSFIEILELKPVVMQNENNLYFQRPRFFTLQLYNQEETFNNKLETLGIKDSYYEIEDWFEEIKIASFLRNI